MHLNGSRSCLRNAPTAIPQTGYATLGLRGDGRRIHCLPSGTISAISYMQRLNQKQVAVLVGAALSCSLLSPGTVAGAQPPWYSIGGYYPGMTKAAARDIGLANCRGSAEAVVCDTVGPIKVGELTATSGRVEFNKSGTLVLRISVQLPSKVVSEQDALKAAETAFGPNELRSSADDNCANEYIWARNTDHVARLCATSGRASWRSHWVSSTLVPGSARDRARAESEAKGTSKYLRGFESR